MKIQVNRRRTALYTECIYEYIVRDRNTDDFGLIRKSNTRGHNLIVNTVYKLLLSTVTTTKEKEKEGMLTPYSRRTIKSHISFHTLNCIYCIYTATLFPQRLGKLRNSSSQILPVVVAKLPSDSRKTLPRITMRVRNVRRMLNRLPKSKMTSPTNRD